MVPFSSADHDGIGTMKKKTRHRKSYVWRKRADSSPTAKGRLRKIRGRRNPRKRKDMGGKKG